jgi:trinucleotide repeat-containing gene 6 protein
MLLTEMVQATLKAVCVQGPGVNNAPSLLNNQSASLASINNISPAIVQKIIAQQPPPQQPPTQQQNAFSQAPRPPQNQPSTAQLRMLVQQIQMAVQAGYLNHQVRGGECVCACASFLVTR